MVKKVLGKGPARVAPPRGMCPLSHGNLTGHLGPLHTRAKSRDHEIVRAQMKVSKGRPNTPPKSCGVVTDSQV